MAARVTLVGELPRDLPPGALLSHGSFLINLEGERAKWGRGRALLPPTLFMLIINPLHRRTPVTESLKALFSDHFFLISTCVLSVAGGVIREDSAYSIAAVPTSAACCPRCRRHTSSSPDCLCPRCQDVLAS